MSRYTQPPILLNAVVAFLKTCGRQGATRPQIIKAVGMSPANINKCLLRWVPRGAIFGAGWDRHMHYFSEKADADAHQARLPELQEAFRKYQHERRKREQREYGRRVTAKKAAIRPPKPPKAEPIKATRVQTVKAPKVSIERAKNPFTIVKGRDVPVKIATPTPAVLAKAETRISSDVKVTVCPSWTHDVRYQVDPRRRVIGEFTTEWRQRRAA